MKHYNYILFDWDGCLAKTLDIWLDAYKQIFAEYGVYPEDNFITQQIFGDWNGPSKVGIKDVEAYTKKLLTKVNEKYPHIQLYEGAYDVVSELKSKGKKLALVTSIKKETLQTALENNKLDKKFDIVLTADDVTKHKPDPEVVYKAIEMLKGIKEETVIIGDSKSDLGAGKNAGIDSILYYPKHNELFHKIEDLNKYTPTFVVTNLSEIPNLIN